MPHHRRKKKTDITVMEKDVFKNKKLIETYKIFPSIIQKENLFIYNICNKILTIKSARKIFFSNVHSFIF